TAWANWSPYGNWCISRLRVLSYEFRAFSPYEIWGPEHDHLCSYCTAVTSRYHLAKPSPPLPHKFLRCGTSRYCHLFSWIRLWRNSYCNSNCRISCHVSIYPAFTSSVRRPPLCNDQCHLGLYRVPSI